MKKEHIDLIIVSLLCLILGYILGGGLLIDGMISNGSLINNETLINYTQEAFNNGYNTGVYSVADYTTKSMNVTYIDQNGNVDFIPMQYICDNINKENNTK